MSVHTGAQEADIAARERPAGDPPATRALPEVVIHTNEAESLERLAVASRRGRLPGFEARPAGGGLFAVAAHGHPFDGVLTGEYQADQGGGRMRFRLALHRKLPVIFAAVLLLTIWPGAYFMDELIAQFTPGWWRPWVTYYWYLPLTALPAPWIWASLMRRSRVSIHAASVEAIGTIAKELGGEVV